LLHGDARELYDQVGILCKDAVQSDIRKLAINMRIHWRRRQLACSDEVVPEHLAQADVAKIAPGFPSSPKPSSDQCRAEEGGVLKDATPVELAGLDGLSDQAKNAEPRSDDKVQSDADVVATKMFPDEAVTTEVPGDCQQAHDSEEAPDVVTAEQVASESCPHIYVCERVLGLISTSLADGNEITPDLIDRLTNPDLIADDAIMVPIDLRGMDLGGDYSNQAAEECGPRGSAEAFLKAKAYFDAHDKDVEVEAIGTRRPKPMTAAEWKLSEASV